MNTGLLGTKVVHSFPPVLLCSSFVFPCRLQYLLKIGNSPGPVTFWCHCEEAHNCADGAVCGASSYAAPLELSPVSGTSRKLYGISHLKIIIYQRLNCMWDLLSFWKTGVLLTFQTFYVIFLRKKVM